MMSRKKPYEIYVHPRASASPVNRPNRKWCDSIDINSPSRTSASLLHATHVVAFCPCQAPGLPWSTTALVTATPFCRDRDIRSKIDSVSTLNSPYPGPTAHSSQCMLE